MELTTFDIEYRPHPTIKAQALADFISDGVRFQEPSEGDQKPWVLVVDESSTSGGSGVGLMIRSPDRQTWPYALHFEFWVSNNKAKYEALLARLRLVKQLEE